MFPTGADSSFQNDLVDCGYQKIATSIQGHLFSEGLNIKLWMYIFHHALQIRNALPCRG